MTGLAVGPTHGLAVNSRMPLIIHAKVEKFMPNVSAAFNIVFYVYTTDGDSRPSSVRIVAAKQ